MTGGDTGAPADGVSAWSGMVDLNFVDCRIESGDSPTITLFGRQLPGFAIETSSPRVPAPGMFRLPVRIGYTSGIL
jgi:hypothetical protein